MATRRIDEPRSSSTVEIFWVRVTNATDANVDGAFRTVQQVRNGSAKALPGPRQEKALPGKNGKTPRDNEDQEDPGLFVDAVAQEVESDTDDSSSDEAKQSADSTAKRTKKFPTPKAVPDLNFVEGKPLVTLVQEKKPTNDWDRYLVIAAWLREHRQMPSITPDHMYTAYRFLGANGINWALPKDMGSVFRDSKKKKSYWDNGEKKNWWNLNHIGETRFNQLPVATE